MRFLPIVLVVFAVSCASRSLPLSRVVTPCASDPSLRGTWTDTRMTQFGPAWVKLSLEPDCTSRMRIQLLWLRITESAGYHTADGVLIFERASGDTRWPYEVAGNRLGLREARDETHSYTRPGH